LKPEFKIYQKQVKANAARMSAELAKAGYRIVSGGTDSHVLSVDLRAKNITGKQAEIALDKAGITCNKNTIPYDPQKPMITSGIRLGTPAVTTRGMKEDDMATIVAFIDEAILNHENEAKLAEISKKVEVFLQKFPLYPDMQ
jgi:glycine hydroxymethyltransferase